MVIFPWTLRMISQLCNCSFTAMPGDVLGLGTHYDSNTHKTKVAIVVNQTSNKKSAATRMLHFELDNNMAESESFCIHNTIHYYFVFLYGLTSTKLFRHLPRTLGHYVWLAWDTVWGHYVLCLFYLLVDWLPNIVRYLYLYTFTFTPFTFKQICQINMPVWNAISSPRRSTRCYTTWELLHSASQSRRTEWPSLSISKPSSSTKSSFRMCRQKR